MMAPFGTRLPPLAGCARRALSTATLGRTAATLGRETDAADFWRRSQDGVVLPELSAQLEERRAREKPGLHGRPARPLAADKPRQPLALRAASADAPKPEPTQLA